MLNPVWVCQTKPFWQVFYPLRSDFQVVDDFVGPRKLEEGDRERIRKKKKVNSDFGTVAKK